MELAEVHTVEAAQTQSVRVISWYNIGCKVRLESKWRVAGPKTK
jgi:hypothetical protein